ALKRNSLDRRPERLDHSRDSPLALSKLVGDETKHMPDAPPGKFMVDPYLDWVAAEGVPIHEGFGFDLLTLETALWPRFGVKGAIVHVKGRGDFMTVFLLEIPPGGKSAPMRHLCEAVFFVLAGQGSSIVEDHRGEK